jgi:NADPH:quinone reductase
LRALTATGTDALVAFEDVSDPDPDRGELLIDVGAFSINRGELRRLRNAARGWRPGWDFVGTVVRGSDTSESVAVGQQVFGLAAGGAWAERISIARDRVATVPSGLDPIVAAALPVAGLTALRILSGVGPIEGRRVLVTGAAGGVGRFAVQLAHRGGAEVTAVVGRAGRGADLPGLGASMVSLGVEATRGQFNVILESVGGPSLARCLALLAPRGVLVSFGVSSGQRAKIDVAAFYPRRATMRGYYLLDDVLERPPREDLERLAEEVAGGRLRVDVPLVMPWTQAPVALKALSDRSIEGKSVLVVERRLG